MAKIYLALGSNVGDKLANINQAIMLLSQKIKITKLSKVYETKPMIYMDQDNFLNAALEGTTGLEPKALLAFVGQTELDVGREQRFRNGPREIDIDILFYDKLVFEDAQLELPHPSLHHREFVLRPMLDLNSRLVHPVYKKTMRQLYKALPKEAKCVIGKGKPLKKPPQRNK